MKVENVDDVEKNAVRIDFAGAMMSMKKYAEHTDFLDYVGMKLIKLADAAIDKSREQSHIYYADWTEHEIIILASLMQETTKKGGFRKMVEFLGTAYESFLDFALPVDVSELLDEENRRGWLISAYRDILLSVLKYVRSIHNSSRSLLRDDYEDYRCNHLRPLFREIFE